MLIEEIETAAKNGSAAALEMIHTPYWPRIRAALIAAQGMDAALVGLGYTYPGQWRFREAMGE